ncbi:MAG: S8 family serine peptidase [Candidatus Melainabacteria bacterium]|nr:S8 family serine peptidase [Candidatus Melainabacteria bacterium]
MKQQKTNRPLTKLLALALTLCVGGVAGLTSSAPALAQQQNAAKSPKPPAVPNQILVMVHAGADKDEVSDAIKNMDGKLLKTISNGSLVCQLIQVPPGKTDECIDKLSKDKEHFDDAQLNVISHKLAFPPTPNDPGFAQQYHLANMNVPAAWSLNGSGSGVTVGVIDSGVIGTEVDLTPRVAVGLNVITGGAGNTDQTPGVNPFQHGTFVSTCSMASTNNNLLGASPAFLANIVPVNVFDVNSSTSDASVLEALFYLEGKGVKLINLSVNADVPFTFSSKKFHKVLYAAFQDYYRHFGGLLFNAAGNDGQFDSNGRTPGLIVISAIDSNSQLASFSTRGNSLWFAAPGVNIVSGAGDNTLQTASGTSFASPLAMSVAAQLWGLHPGWTNAHVLHAMQASATSPHGTETLFGFGQVNAGAALLQP